MALSPCRECGHQVSSEAATCPSCGAKDPTGAAKRKQRSDAKTTMISLGIAAIVVFAGVAYCSSGSDTTSADTAAADTFATSWNYTPSNFAAVANALTSASSQVRVEPYDPQASKTMRIIIARGDVDAYSARKLAVTARDRLGADWIVYVKDDTGKTLAKAAPWGVSSD